MEISQPRKLNEEVEDEEGEAAGEGLEEERGRTKQREERELRDAEEEWRAKDSFHGPFVISGMLVTPKIDLMGVC